MLPALEALAAIYEYSPTLDCLVHKRLNRPYRGFWNSKTPGSTYGKMCIVYKRKKYSYHRVLWFLAYGFEAPGYIDHIDKNPRNNSLANLRVLTHQENIDNRTRQGCVYFAENRKYAPWIAQIGYHGKYYRKSRATEAAAHLALEELRVKFWP